MYTYFIFRVFNSDDDQVTLICDWQEEKKYYKKYVKFENSRTGGTTMSLQTACCLHGYLVRHIRETRKMLVSYGVDFKKEYYT